MRSVEAESIETSAGASGQRLKHVVSEIRQGWSPQCYPWPADGVETWGVLKAGAVNGGVFRAAENKELPDAEVPRPELAVRRGDLVISRANTRELLGSAAVVEGDYPKLMLCDKLYALKLDPLRADSRYVALVLGTQQWRGLIELQSSGSSPSMQNISQSDILNLPMDLPPIGTQRAITDYLDRETACLDSLIAEQQRLIELLRERRAVNLGQVATLGPEPGGHVVDTGLFWAPKVPAHWRIVPLTAAATLESGHTPSRSVQELWESCTIPWISLNDVGAMATAEYIATTTNLISEQGIAVSSARVLPKGTVVLSRDATVGRSSIMQVPMATSQHFADWVCGPELMPEYLWLLFVAAMQPYFESLTNGATLRTIGMADLKAFRIPLPPLNEQRAITDVARRAATKADALIRETERFIELAQERRSALITAAVTGQLDIAPKLAG